MAERPASTILSADLAVHRVCSVRARCRPVRRPDRAERPTTTRSSSCGVPRPRPPTTPNARCGPGWSWSTPGSRPGSAWPSTTSTEPPAVLRGAAPGEVWVTEHVRSRTSAAIRYTDRGRPEILGDTEPSRLFRADAVVDVVGGSGRPQHSLGPARRLPARARADQGQPARRDRRVGRPAARRRGRGRVRARPASAPSWSTTSTAWPGGSGGCGAAARRTAGRPPIPRSSRCCVGGSPPVTEDDLATLRGKLERTARRAGPHRAGAAVAQPSGCWRCWSAMDVADPGLSQDELFDAWLFWFEHLGGTRAGRLGDRRRPPGRRRPGRLLRPRRRRAASPVLVLALGRPEVLDRFAGVGPAGAVTDRPAGRALARRADGRHWSTDWSTT